MVPLALHLVWNSRNAQYGLALIWAQISIPPGVDLIVDQRTLDIIARGHPSCQISSPKPTSIRLIENAVQ